MKIKSERISRSAIDREVMPLQLKEIVIRPDILLFDLDILEIENYVFLQ